MNTMLRYLPADGVNQPFKYYFLYNYYYFHFLYNLMYPSAKNFTLELTGKKRVMIKGKTPAAIEETYKRLTGKPASYFDDPLGYNASIANSTAYLKVGSFYKGFIENFGRHYAAFIDSSFKDLQANKIKNLIIDLRDNEGGGDGYEDSLFAHFTDKPFTGVAYNHVPGRTFPMVRYAINLDDDVKAYIENPTAFLRNDSSLLLKPEYTSGQGTINPSKERFGGNIYVLINGGSFSATTFFIRNLYNYSRTAKQTIVFIGEENGGDIYSNIQCAGKSYIIKLPNSAITVDMPILCQGDLKRNYPPKHLPDYEVYATIQDVITGSDAVLKKAIQLTTKSE